MNPDAAPGAKEPPQRFSQRLRRVGALLHESGAIYILVLVALLFLGGVWLAVSLADRWWSTDYLTKSGLVLISGPPATTAVSLIFFSASLGAVALSLLSPSLRARFFRIETASPQIVDPIPGLWGRTFAPIRPIEWVAILGTNLGILGLRFGVYPFPQGADTPQYLEAANSILFQFDLRGLTQLHAVGVGRWLTVLGVTVLRVILLPAPGEPELLTMMAVPIVLGVVYSLSMWAFVYHLMGDHRIAAWAATLAPISFLTIRLSYDLFGQFLGQSLSNFALAGFIAFVLQGRGRAGTAAALYVAALLAHIWTWAMFTALSGVILGWALLAAQSRIEKLRRALVVVGPSLFGMGLLMVILANVQVVALYPYSVGDARPFSLPKGWLWIGGLESGVDWGLGTVALFVLATRPSSWVARVPLLLWTATMSAAVFVLGLNDSHRFLMMYPMPILVAIGMRWSSTWLRTSLSSTFPSGLRLRLVRAAPAVALSLVLLGSIVPRAYIPEWRYFPGEEAYEQLKEIRDAYGYGNESIIILIDPGYFENAFLWASAVTGAQTYPGNLLSLLRGDPFPRDLHRWFVPNLTGVTQILLPSKLYTPDSLEATLLAVGTIPGVPVYHVATAFNPSSFLAAAALPVSDSFWMNWTLESSTIPHSISTVNSEVAWTFPAEAASEETRQVSYVRSLPNRSAESLYFIVTGSLGGITGALEVLSSSGNSTAYVLDRVPATPSLVRLPLPAGEILDRLRVTFWLGPGESSTDGRLKFSFIGLLMS